MRIHCFQHAGFETPGTITAWAAQKGYPVSFTYFFQPSYAIPSLQDIDLLLIMGGYMNVDEEVDFPWLKAEKEYIRQAIAAGKKVIGICLGAQLIAAALGSKVYKGAEKEIGFFSVNFSAAAQEHDCFRHFPETYPLFHWHGDTFDLPEGALLIASTPVCRHQAYLIGNQVLGLQFHLEMTPESIEQMILHGEQELEQAGNYIQPSNTIRAGCHHLTQNKKDLFLLLDRLFLADVSR